MDYIECPLTCYFNDVTLMTELYIDFVAFFLAL